MICCKKILQNAAGLSLGAAAALAVLFSQESKDGAAHGLTLCLKVLVPSLFPLMTMTQLSVNTGLCARLGHRLRAPTRRLFGISGSFAPIFLLSMIGGYPTGAAGIRELYSHGELSEREARKAALFAVGAGPGFLLNYVGGGLYGSPQLGTILFAAQIISALLLGIAANRIYPTAEYISKKESKTASMPFSQAMTTSVYAASRATVVIVGFVTLFSALLGILETLLKNETAHTVITSALEVCAAAEILRDNSAVEFVAFAAGFGGLCVHCQIIAALGEVRVRKELFFVFRIMQGLLSAFFTHLLLRIFPMPSPVFSTHAAAAGELYGGSILSGIMLISVAIGFLSALKKQS